MRTSKMGIPVDRCGAGGFTVMVENAHMLAHRSQRGMVARGSAAWLSARLVYIITGLMIHIMVSRALGPEQYGEFGAVMAVAAGFYMGIGAMVPPAVSRYIAAGNVEEGSIFWTGLKIQGLVSAAVALGFWVTGDHIASGILGDANLATQVRIAGLIVVPSGLVFVYEAALLGRLNYLKASYLSGLLSLVRLASVGLAVAVGGGVIGVLGGYLAAESLIASFAAWKIRFKKPTVRTFDWRKIVTFSVPMLVAGILMGLILQMSTLFVNAFTPAPEMVGIFVAASVVANVPFHIFRGSSTVLMPAVSSAVSGNDARLLGQHVRESLRVMILLCVPCVLWIHLNAEMLVGIVFGDRYLGAAPVLQLLVVGTACLACGRLLLSVLDGLGRPWVSVSMILGTALVIAAANIVLIPRLGLIGPGYAVALGGVGIFLISGFYVYFRCGVLFPYRSFARIVLAGVIAFLIASQMRTQGMYDFVIQTIVVGTVYPGLLWALGEFVDLNISSSQLLNTILNRKPA